MARCRHHIEVQYGTPYFGSPNPEDFSLPKCVQQLTLQDEFKKTEVCSAGKGKVLPVLN
jgi:hypothetical protein